jgi:hypothetical protein
MLFEELKEFKEFWSSEEEPGDWISAKTRGVTVKP